MNKPYSPEEIAKIYQLNQDGVPKEVIAQNMGRSIVSIYQTLQRLDRHMNFNMKKRKGNGQYQKAAALIKKSDKPEKVEPNTDPFEKVESAIKEVVEVISKQVVAGVLKDNQALKVENQQLKAEIVKLQELRDAAKESNLVTNLRRHFGLPA